MKRVALTLAVPFVLLLLLVNPYVRGDGNGYYAWLTSPILDGDVDFGNQYQRADPMFRAAFIDDDGRPTAWMRTATGKVENQWSIGPALLWLPAFAVAHAGALAGLGTPDGYSSIYLILVSASTAIYGLLAILIGADLARRFGYERQAPLAALAVLLASSLPVYMAVLPFHVHALAAFSGALFFWWGLVRVQGWDVRVWAIWGLASGLLVVVYFVQAVFLVLVIVQLARKGAWTDRAKAALAFGAGMLPFVALHVASRMALYGSATTTGYRDEFFWFSPRLWAVAFSPDHGLFLWTPVLLLALLGLARLAIADTRARAVLLVWAIFFYVIASYQNWHGQSSFGNRFFVSLTAVFVPGVAVCLAWLSARRRGAAAVVVMLLALWNAGFVFQWAFNVVPNRGSVDFSAVARNQVTVVPARLMSTVWRYLADRRGLTREVEGQDRDERRNYRLQR